MLSTILGAALGSTIDGQDGDDGTMDGALAGAAVATGLRLLAPLVLTYATGWLVLRGIGKAKDAMSAGERVSA